MYGVRLTQNYDFHTEFFADCVKLFKKKRGGEGGKKEDRTIKPGRSRQNFSGRKNPQHAFLWRGSKAVGPMSQICGM